MAGLYVHTTVGAPDGDGDKHGGIQRIYMASGLLAATEFYEACQHF